MDLDDLLDVGEDYPMHCYVCNTTIEVKKQDVFTGDDDNWNFETLPVCHRCSSAVGIVLELENAMDDLFNRVCEVNDERLALAAHLLEGKDLMLKLVAFAGIQQQKIDELDKKTKQSAEVIEYMQDANAEWFDYAVSLEEEVADLKKRIEEGAGLDDVEVTVIASADYEN